MNALVLVGSAHASEFSLAYCFVSLPIKEAAQHNSNSNADICMATFSGMNATLPRKLAQSWLSIKASRRLRERCASAAFSFHGLFLEPLCEKSSSFRSGLSEHREKSRVLRVCVA